MWRTLRTVAVVVLAAIAVLAIPAGVPGGATSAGTHAAPAGALVDRGVLSSTGVSRSVPSASPSGSTPLPSPSTAALSRAQTILNLLRKDGVPAQDVHLPNLAAEGPHSSRQVGLLYPAAPAPMGVSDIGLRNVSGNLVPYVLNTSSVKGSITFTNAQSMYVDGDGPDMFGVQLNAVVTNVTLFGNSTYQFWAQNFVSYTSSSGELAFGDNVWNFSASNISSNVFYETGPNGSLFAPIYYYATGPTFTVHYPFTVTFYTNASTLFDRPAVFFNYSVSSATVHASGSYDFIVFNSTAGTPTSKAPVPQFQVNGEQYNPVGLLNDIELDVVGNDDGDTTTFYQMQASLSIDYWNGTRGAYSPVPSAFDAGTDTGETSNGVEVYYTAPGGVVQPVAQMVIGPSFLRGLWNVSSAAGVRLFQETQTPVNAFLFINPGTTFNETTAQWVPTVPFGAATSNFGIPNDGGSYFFEWLLSDYLSAGAAFNTPANSTHAFTRTLVHSNAAGVYTPLLAWGNGELAAISSSGAGTKASPYVLESNQIGSIDPVFSQWNVFLWPVFSGILLVDTTDWVTVTPPTFQIIYPPGFNVVPYTPGLPNTNDLQLEFAYVSNVTLTNAPSIGGWLSSYLVTSYPLGAVIFWNSTGNLIAHNTFYDVGSSLAMYGGTNNTVWGNSFLATTLPTAYPSSIFDATNVTGLFESESGDLVYNNYFDVTNPAYTPTYEPLLCQIICEAASYVDTWNVSLEPANATATFLGSSLTGSIIGTWYQGGNFWSNYGTASNPYGPLPLVVPYNDSGWITNGGDYVPLVPSTLYSITFSETGLASGTPWNVTALGVTTLSVGTTLVIWAPNGSYDFSVPSPAGYQGPSVGSFTVNGASVSVSLTFAPLEPVTFTETGLIRGSTWTVSVPGSGGTTLANGTSENTTLVLDLAGGSPPVAYSGLAKAFGYALVTWSTEVGTSPVSVGIAFIPQTDLEFEENGLPTGTPWTVHLQQGNWSTDVTSLTTMILFLKLNTPTGLVNFTISSTGFLADPATGSMVIPEIPTIGVVFTPVNGTLVTRVTPVSATLLVNGHVVPLASNGSASVSLAAGLYSVEVTAPGAIPYYNNVSVVSDHTTSLTISLTTVPGTPAPAVSPAAWAAIGLLAAVAVVLGLIALAYRSRGRRPPPKPVAPASGAPLGEKGSWSEAPSPPTEK